MRPLPPDLRPLRSHLGGAGRFVCDGSVRLCLADIAGRSWLGAAALDALRGKSVLLQVERQMTALLGLAELDGVAQRIVLCPPQSLDEHLKLVIEEANITAAVTDSTAAALPSFVIDAAKYTSHEPSGAAIATEWVLFTSGTTSRPKMVVHDLASLAAPVASSSALEQGCVWSTFYDVRRYGGMAMLMRALIGGGSMVLSEPDEPVAGFFDRLAASRVTHLSGTPSHWRRVLMSGEAKRFAPRYVRLSGEVADQALLDRLRSAFPDAFITHAFASTEAGVGFAVADGGEGFPVRLVEQPGGAAELRVMEGCLQMRSPSTAKRYLGQADPALRDADGFVDTGDMLERRGDRYLFAGRRTGVINVGGFKVHPEMVETVINRHPSVLMARVRARRSPITGAVVVADVVVNDPAADLDALAAGILQSCQSSLARHMVPVSVRFVPALEILATGKLARRVA